MAINLLELQPHKISTDLSGYITYIYGTPKVGKAQPIDTVIPTPFGDKKMGDLQPGDWVYDREGCPTTVKEVFPQGKLKKLKVTLNDGRVTYCGPKHNWTYITSRGNFKTVTAQEMIDSGRIARLEQGKHGYTHFYKIPMAEAVDKTEKDFAIDPYVLGVFLGDGCCKERSLTLSSDDEEIVRTVAERIGATEYKKNSEYNYSWNFFSGTSRITTKSIFEFYAEQIMCGAADKRIPSVYFEGSIEQRYELLRGLLDTDGCINIDGTVTFSSINRNLIEDVRKLVFSLGYRTGKVVEDKRSEKYKNGVCYTIRINCLNTEKPKLFKLKRKYDRAINNADNPQRRRYDRIEIANIEDTGEEAEMVCILVDNEEHLYLTNDYIVTHNTSLAAQAEDCLLLATERGYNAIGGIYAIDITSWSEMRQVYRELKKDEVKARYKVLIVDTIDLAAKYCTKYICNKENIEELGSLPYGKGYSLMREEFEDVFNSLAQLGYAIIFISHAQDSVFTRADGTEYTKIIPSLSPAKVNAIIENMADIYGYAHIIKNADGSSQRVLTLRSPDDSVACGGRFAYIEPEIPLGYDSLVNAMREAIKKETEAKGEEVVTSEPIKPIYNDVDFDAEIATFNDIVTKLQEIGGGAFGTLYAPRIQEIVTKYLGAGKTVTEMSRNQVEQLVLINDELKEWVGNGI